MTISRFTSRLKTAEKKLGPERYARLAEAIQESLSKVEHSGALRRYCSPPLVSPFDVAALLAKQIAYDKADSPMAEWGVEEQLDTLTAFLILRPTNIEAVEICSMYPFDRLQQCVKDFDSYPVAEV